MKDIYLIFSYTGTYFSTFLRFMTREKYVHVSIAFDKDLEKVYSFGRKNPKWIYPNGFVREDMNLIVNFFKNADCQIYSLPITKKQYYDLKKEIEKYMKNENDFYYNIKGLVFIQFNKIYHRSHHFVCSQFVGKILQNSHVYDFKKDYSIIKPKDIITMKNLKIIYEGKIADYLRKVENG